MMPTDAQQIIDGLRRLANVLEANPELAEDISHTVRYGFLGLPQFGTAANKQRARLALWARAAKKQGATVTKDASGDRFKMNVDFGAVAVTVLADREEVCERVVVGTEEVTRTVPDPEFVAAAPMVEVTETVETVEWRCGPILDGKAATAEPAVTR